MRRTGWCSRARWVLKGTLGAEKARMLAQVHTAIEQPHNAGLRPAWARAL